MEILAKVYRGALAESVHYGVIAVVDGEGRIIADIGDINYITYFRSAAKPIQAMTVLDEGAGEHFKLEKDEIAIMTASHSGQAEHLAVVHKILTKIGLSESALQCGVQRPFHRPSADNLLINGQKPGVIHCNCSGKHAGMLALAQYKGYSLDKYFDINHPVQQSMLNTVAYYCDYPKDKIIIGIDGCGVPVFGLPVYNMAKAYAGLMKAEGASDNAKKIISAMLEYPFLVAGSDRLCTVLMEKTKGKIIAKIGAEGIYCIGVRDKDMGIAVKVADGNQRPLGPIIIEVLAQLKVLDDQELSALNTLHRPGLKNMKGEIIGEIRPEFQLNFR